eukprot:CAMPEP_0172533868 /NCGR_PEP_ID=MMETSP1067-20121228/6432_1 /TAXON_ID=265564 ORGANISM="Thalassiosira punctigera, Strain Tpunct2005C2" /NCGR_SAMPLE_ID=MMETSP1067 /ASSEMBLY_ACC=CAM_ASM_000444 /LENGTH=151 /DNA_ID=CAMNT_0013318579 /DNA_START=335 /DNA_END=790 /DNA_ORIENTATION=+
MNFLVNLHLFLYLGISLYLSTATFTVFCILSDTTLPTRAPRGLRRGGLWTRFHPGMVDMSASSLLVMLLKEFEIGPPSSSAAGLARVDEKFRAAMPIVARGDIIRESCPQAATGAATRSRVAAMACDAATGGAAPPGASHGDAVLDASFSA